MLSDLLFRLRCLFRRRVVESELEEELRFHLERQIEKSIELGQTREEAMRRARLEFGGFEQIKQDCRGTRGLTFVEELVQDIFFAVRILRRNPGFAAVVMLTLALGVGANTAIFSVVQGVILAPLPFHQPDRLVVPWQKNLTHNYVADISYLDFRDWQHSSRSFEEIAAITWKSYDLTSPGGAEHLDGNHVSAGFFSVLGVKPALGRFFLPQEDQQGGAPVAVISDRLWKERFGGNSTIFDQRLVLDGVGYTVIGVLPEGFRFWMDTDVYLPLGQDDPATLKDRGIHNLLPVARLKPGVSLDQAQAEMTGVQENLDRLYPAVDRGLGTEIVPLKQVIVGDTEKTLLLLLGAVAIVLLIACANIANLLFAHSAARTQELAVRSVLGAPRARILRQLITESLLLSLVGGGLGLAAAKLGVRAILATMGQMLPRSQNIEVNLPVLLFALGISIGAGILFGLAPALRSSEVDPEWALKTGGRGFTKAHQRTQSVLVIVQMALTLVLSIGGVLLFRTIRHLWEVDPGFRPNQVITFKVGLSPSVTKTPSSLRVAYRQLIERISRVPGIEAAELTSLVPLSDQDNSGPFWVGSQGVTSMAEAPHALYFETGPDYLKTMKIPLLRGRFFSREDTANSEPVIVIDSVLANNYFPGTNPVGHTITVAHWRAARIIGVVGHVRHWGLGNAGRYTQNQIYISFYQLPDQLVPIFYPELTIAVRTALDPTTIMPLIKAMIYGAGSDQPVYEIQTMQKVVSRSMSPQRFPMILMGAFAGLALFLASVGIYGVVSWSAAQRVHEIGIRMALGAKKSDVFVMVIKQGLHVAMTGVLLGIATALVLAKILSSFTQLLSGIGASDPITFATVSVALTGVAILACYFPARRATRTDPIIALRYE